MWWHNDRIVNRTSALRALGPVSESRGAEERPRRSRSSLDGREDSEWDARRCHVGRRPLSLAIRDWRTTDNSAGLQPCEAPQAASWLIDGQPSTLQVVPWTLRFINRLEVGVHCY